MTIGQALLPEFDQEMATTRRVLERVPTDKGQWKPHPKSFSLGDLAQLVSFMPGWITLAVRQDFIDLASFEGYSQETTPALLAAFDKNVREAREALASVPDAAMSQPWSLRHGDRVLFTLPRGAAVRTDINHLVHHRAQLGVYLRLLDIPVPAMYGPSADERPW